MRGRRVSDIWAEIKALVVGHEVDDWNAQKLEQTSHIGMRLIDLGQTLADEANMQAMSLNFPPIDDEDQE
jgi:hypothetical protein